MYVCLPVCLFFSKHTTLCFFLSLSLSLFYLIVGTTHWTRQAVKSDLETTGKQGDLAASDKQETNEPTKYHFYPHNQHLYLLPECATQQVNIPFISAQI